MVYIIISKFSNSFDSDSKFIEKYTIQRDALRAVDLKIPEVMTAATKTHLNFQVGRIFQLSKYIIPKDHK